MKALICENGRHMVQVDFFFEMGEKIGGNQYLIFSKPYFRVGSKTQYQNQNLVKIKGICRRKMKSLYKNCNLLGRVRVEKNVSRDNAFFK